MQGIITLRVKDILDVPQQESQSFQNVFLSSIIPF